MTSMQRSLQLFGISTENLKKLTETALSKGGDYSDLFFEHTIVDELTLRDGEVNGAGSHIDYGMGVRVLSEDQTGYAYTEITTMNEMENAAKAASLIARGSSQGVYSTDVTPQNFKNHYPIIKPWEDSDITSRAPFIKELNDKIFSLDPRVNKVIAKLTNSTTDILFYNSYGTLCSEVRPLATLSVTVIMQSGSRVENGSSSRSYRMGAEFLTHNLIDEIAQEAVTRTAILFKAGIPEGGEMPVVMGAGGSGILLHEAIGHAFEADFNRQNISIFSDKLGQKICSPEISVVDDGTVQWNRGSVNFDDEGIAGQKTYMVTDGYLTSYLHDRISATYYKTKPTGNGRRESFRYMPLPRMRATYMNNGKSKEADIIASVKRGIFVDNFSNGQVQIGAGDFTFFVKSGYMIENGKLTTPIKDINIIGNGPKALADIVAVADNSYIDNGAWTCGKEQYCPVSCGMPSVLINKLTVGGLQQ
ncbi:MAG: TldD/PmbA family protein [Rikenellaceae bacterium]|nr:TldD/PmbA family protein [Rikenellaceae bacterium]